MSCQSPILFRPVSCTPCDGDGDGGGPDPPDPPEEGPFLLLENGAYLLFEDGSKILLG